MKRATFPLLILLLLLGVSAAAWQQRDPGAQPQTGRGAIVGTVYTTDNPAQPVRRATISISGGGLRGQRQTVTDNAGRFVLAGLPNGSFSLSATKPAFVTTSHGSKQPGQPGTPVSVVDGQQTTVELRMPRGAVLSGMVIDQFGRPRQQVRVQALSYRTSGGQRRLQPTNQGSTDDRGMYRFFGLQPGDYIVMAALPSERTDVRMMTSEELRWAASSATTAPPSPGRPIGFAPIYFPGVSDVSAATTITLNAGEERLGLNFQLMPTTTATIEGVVVDADGKVAQQPQLQLVPDERLRIPSLPRMDLPSERARVDSQTGKFTFSGVTPGRYMLIATRVVRPGAGGAAPMPGMPVPAVPPVPASAPGAVVVPRPAAVQPSTYWATAQVDVSGQDLTGLTLTLQPPLSITGRLVFESGTQTTPVDATRVRVSASILDSPPLSSNVPAVTANPDGTFTLRGAVPGRYRLSTSLTSSQGQLPIGPWIVKSIAHNGREALDGGLDVPPGDVSGVVITLTDQVSDISGTLLDATGAPTRDFWVMVFSTDRSHWIPQSRRMRVTRPGQDGRFRFGNWPPGEYYMVAVTDGDQIDLADRASLEQIAAVSLKITLAEGEKKIQDLKLQR